MRYIHSNFGLGLKPCHWVKSCACYTKLIILTTRIIYELVYAIFVDVKIKKRKFEPTYFEYGPASVDQIYVDSETRSLHQH